MAFFNKYPYTDFHELNIDFVLKKLTEIDTKIAVLEATVADHETRIGSLEGRTTALEGRTTALEGRMTTAESDISSLKSRATSLEGRMTTAEGKITALETNDATQDSRLHALESADIQSAKMLSDQTGITQSATNVTIGFTKDVYINGAKTSTSSDNAVIPAATTSAAGVMVPGDKAKLEPITVNGNDLTFAGALTLGDGPNTNNDAVTKAYVDALAISGVVGTTEISTTWSTARGTISNPPLGNKLYRYGNMRALRFGVGVDNITQAIGNGDIVAYIDLPTGDEPPTNNYYYFDSYIENKACELEVLNNGRCAILNRGSVTYGIGESTPTYGGYITWLVM